MTAPTLLPVKVEVVEPFPPYAVPRLWSWSQEFFNRVADDYAPKTLEQFVKNWEEKAREGRRTWGVLRDGELGGMVCSTRISPVLADAHCIFKRSFWGHQTTAEALRMVFDQIFESGAEKICSTAFRTNHALFGLVKKLGFQREGMLRSHTRQSGEPVDVAIVGLLKEEFYGHTQGNRAGVGGGEQTEPAVEPVAKELTACHSS